MVADASGRVERILSAAQRSLRKDGSPPSVGERLAYSELLGRRVLAGDFERQRTSTVVQIREELRAGRFREAAELVDFFLDEAAVIFGIYRPWLNDLNEFLLARGLSEDEIRDLNARILALLTLPDGRPFEARILWEELRAKVRELILLCGEKRAEDALVLLDEVKESWRRIHDRDVDHVYGLMNEIVVRFGEETLAEMWEETVGGLFEMRYGKFDVDRLPWSESLGTNLYLAFEAMRGHLVGPGREGNMEFEEDDERFTLRFDPCGSGGHLVRGDDEVEATPPRMEPPYGWAVIEGEHDFAWNTKGVCLYCTNCCVVMQQKPIEAFGYPVRVVEPPTYPATAHVKCTWHIYKDPAKVPERYYEAVGRRKPSADRLGSGGGGAPPAA
jgi:hypothetical protein